MKKKENRARGCDQWSFDGNRTRNGGGNCRRKFNKQAEESLSHEKKQLKKRKYIKRKKHHKGRDLCDVSKKQRRSTRGEEEFKDKTY